MELNIEKRIDDATTSPQKFNHWPDKLDVIKVTTYDLANAEQAWEAGCLWGGAAAHSGRAFRQIYPDRVPYSIRKQVKISKRHWMLSTYFVPAYARGQMDDEATRNLHALFEVSDLGRRSIYPYKKKLIAVELGCKHDYDRTGSRMCLDMGTCRKCGHKFLCDSSD